MACTCCTFVLSCLQDKNFVKMQVNFLTSCNTDFLNIISVYMSGYFLFLFLEWHLKKSRTSTLFSVVNISDLELFIKMSHFTVEMFLNPGLQTKQCEHTAWHAVKCRKQERSLAFWQQNMSHPQSIWLLFLDLWLMALLKPGLAVVKQEEEMKEGWGKALVSARQMLVRCDVCKCIIKKKGRNKWCSIQNRLDFW